MQVGERALREQRAVESCEEVDSARFARCSPRHGCHSEYPMPGHPQQVRQNLKLQMPVSAGKTVTGSGTGMACDKQVHGTCRSLVPCKWLDVQDLIGESCSELPLARNCAISFSCMHKMLHLLRQSIDLACIQTCLEDCCMHVNVKGLHADGGQDSHSLIEATTTGTPNTAELVMVLSLCMTTGL